jgi:hypothetical protein
MRQTNRGGVAVIHYDTDYMARGTHKGATGQRSIVSASNPYKITLDHDGFDISMPTENFTDPTIEINAMLLDPGKDFKSCGVMAGLAIHNDTDGSNGLVTEVHEDYLFCTLSGGALDIWTNGDQYSIYKTAAYGTKISTHHTDKRFGRKVTGKDALFNGLRPEDEDLDEYTDNVFGPGQPERT